MTEITWNEAALEYLLDDENGPVGRDLARRALNVETRQKQLLSEPGTGRIYDTRFYRDAQGRLRRGGPRTPHQASAPGQPPAVDTGLLRASIGHRIDRDGEGMYADIGSGGNPAIPGVAYALYLEDGTSTLEPRPWLRPSLDAARD